MSDEDDLAILNAIPEDALQQRSITERWADATQPGAAELIAGPVGGLPPAMEPINEQGGEFATSGYPPPTFDEQT